MARSCELCGDPLDDAAFCIIPECPHRDAAKRVEAAASPAPPQARPRSAVGRADPNRRLLASGPEFLILMGLEVFGAFLVPVGAVLSLLLAAYMAVRDLGGGRFSLGKRLAGVRVVDAATGSTPTAQQAVLRNAPYVVGWLMAVLPGFEVVGWAVLLLGAAVDLGLVLRDPLGRRLGDRLANTKVVDGQPDG